MIDRVAFSIFGKGIYWYGIIIAAGVVIGMMVAILNARKRGLKADVIYDFLLMAIPLCVIGARAYYVMFNYTAYQGDIIKMIAIWDGGAAIYGALIGGIVSSLLFWAIKKFPVFLILDICAPSLILGQAIGRWGNFVNQEAYGQLVLNDRWKAFPWAVWIENPVIQGQAAGYYMATFFYESMLNLIIFAILILLTKKLKDLRGSIFALYLSLYGLGRYFIEGFRTDSLMLTSTIRISQALSLVLIVIGVVYVVYSVVKKPVFEPYYGSYSLDEYKHENNNDE